MLLLMFYVKQVKGRVVRKNTFQRRTQFISN